MANMGKLSDAPIAVGAEALYRKAKDPKADVDYRARIAAQGFDKAMHFPEEPDTSPAAGVTPIGPNPNAVEDTEERKRKKK